MLVSAAVSERSGHALQATSATTALNWPCGHATHDPVATSDPVICPVWPMLHRHSEAVVLPTGESEFEGHTSQSSVPSAALKVPLGH